MLKKNILIINGHPLKNSLNNSLADVYEKEAKKFHNIKRINVRELKFNRDFTSYDAKLEKDILDSQTKIKWAEHIVIFTPVWWGNTPALLKAFFDRTLTSGFAYKYKGNFPVGLLKNKSARVIYTQGAPFIFSWLFFSDVFWKTIKKCVLKFCGIKPVKRTSLSMIHKNTKQDRINKYFNKVKKLGEKGK